ncbi:pectinesterase family protein [Arcicella aquatica]|uniref:Pectinesterase n=1 Tax=Arcicella aquatica TaxID=217141 RepID=A0ABU5QM67_9BACT|nr:pectinesterase family protein [Arcicella aquatica]MEA5258161.1 pectinesterase family protein [Arcicella aquatica]
MLHLKYVFLCLCCMLSMELLASPTKQLTVAKDGTGDYKSIQEAFDAVPLHNNNPVVIFVKNGTYKEKIVLDSTKNMVTLVGESASQTILSFDDFSGKVGADGIKITTTTSASTRIVADNFTAVNITFANTAGPVGQAVAMLVDGDKARFINCRFLGFQDTLYPKRAGTRQYYKNCYIEGTVDFIFGWAIAFFDHCQLNGKLDAGFFTAASTPQDQSYGFVFNRCTLTGSAPAATYYLGRPWRDYAKTVFLCCEMSNIIKPEGWHNWHKTNAEKTAFYAEYDSREAGGISQARVEWSKQLVKSDVKKYTIQNVLGGNDQWRAAKGLSKLAKIKV